MSGQNLNYKLSIATWQFRADSVQALGSICGYPNGSYQWSVESISQSLTRNLIIRQETTYLFPTK